MSEWDKVTLESIAGGAAIERFQESLSEVVENILDPNTDVQRVREVKLVLKLKPAKEDRGKVLYSLHVENKLASPISIDNVFFVGKDGEQFTAYEQHIDQGNLFGDFQDKVASIKNIKEV